MTNKRLEGREEFHSKTFWKCLVSMPKNRIGQFLKFHLRQQLFALKEFCMENRLSDIFKTTNVTKLTKAILKSSYRILQVTSKCKILKQPAYF